MANEAVIIELLGNKGDPIRYTCSDVTGIEKGTILKLSDPRTVLASTGTDEVIVGIAAAEKVANDGSTTIAVYTNGIFDITCTAAGATIGKACAIAGANTITDADANDLLQNSVVGMPLETGGNAEVIAVRVLK